MALAFRVICPYCSEPTRASAEAFFRWWPDEEELEKNPLADPVATAAVASYCPECEGLLSLVVQGKDSILRPIMAEDVPSSEWGHYQADIKLVEQHPGTPTVSFSRAVPEEIRQAMPDLLEDVARRRNAAGNLAICGSILEVALRHIEGAASQNPEVTPPE
ncbi:hypothetical protein U0030_13605 [Brevundimonas bullata]|uniref:hypothetical protein n=1 Tax=Brevundimonas bullata TaxID=13160 RepID=UPI0013B4324C|nr:hypothetical protein [Brevundimonas bullata]WQE36292.1 hypothetical protein U0030_13605 [Brevundimonas bullata]